MQRSKFCKFKITGSQAPQRCSVRDSPLIKTEEIEAAVIHRTNAIKVMCAVRDNCEFDWTIFLGDHSKIRYHVPLGTRKVPLGPEVSPLADKGYRCTEEFNETNIWRTPYSPDGALKHVAEVSSLNGCIFHFLCSEFRGLAVKSTRQLIYRYLSLRLSLMTLTSRSLLPSYKRLAIANRREQARGQ